MWLAKRRYIMLVLKVMVSPSFSFGFFCLMENFPIFSFIDIGKINGALREEFS